MSQALIAFDTDHIKRYVFGTSKLKEIRGASSILDRLNRNQTRAMAERDFGATTIYANGGSALFLIDSDKAEDRAGELGKAIQKLYHEETGGGASITYTIQPIPANDSPDIMTATELSENITMHQVLKLLRLRLRLAKDSLQTNKLQKNNSQESHAKDFVDDYVVLPSHALLYTCKSCGIGYAEEMREDPDDAEGLYCRACIKKREEDETVKQMLSSVRKESLSDQTLWGRILQTLLDPSSAPPYELPTTLKRPKDFNVFREFTRRKEYLGLIYADANGMGMAMDAQETLQDVKNFASAVDNAVFNAMGDAIRKHLPIQDNTFPFDILLVGGDDIVIVAPAEKALQVARTLAEQFHKHTKEKYTLSVGVVLAPVKYPFNLQRGLVEEILTVAKVSGVANNASEERSRINFVVVTGNTSLSYAKIYNHMYQERGDSRKSEKFYATMRPYSLDQLRWLLERLEAGNKRRLGRTKLHQLREAILKLNCTTTILESLMLLRNWEKQERDFIKQIAEEFDVRLTPQQQQKGTLFPWSLDGEGSSKNEFIYRTPLLDFIELYDFTS